MRQLLKRHPGSVHTDHGTIMLNLWDCDRVLADPLGAPVLDSRLHRDEESLVAFHALVGKHVSKVELDETKLSLRVAFSEGHELMLSVHSTQKAKDDEQWALESASGASVGIFGLAWVRSTADGEN